MTTCSHSSTQQNPTHQGYFDLSTLIMSSSHSAGKRKLDDVAEDPANDKRARMTGATELEEDQVIDKIMNLKKPADADKADGMCLVCVCFRRDLFLVFGT